MVCISLFFIIFVTFSNSLSYTQQGLNLHIGRAQFTTWGTAATRIVLLQKPVNSNCTVNHFKVQALRVFRKYWNDANAVPQISD